MIGEISFLDENFRPEDITLEVLARGVLSIGVYDSDSDFKEELACRKGEEDDIVSCSTAVVLAVEERVGSVCIRSVGVGRMSVFIAELVISPTVSERN